MQEATSYGSEHARFLLERMHHDLRLENTFYSFEVNFRLMHKYATFGKYEKINMVVTSIMHLQFVKPR